MDNQFKEIDYINCISMASSSSSNADLSDTPKAEDVKQVSVSSDDIKTILSVINVVSRRGGFVPSEFGVVGSLFDKFSKFVEPPADSK